MPLAGGLRTIVEDVSEMPAATAAMAFDACHEQRIVLLGADGVGQRIPEARPAGAGLVFRFRRIDGKIAAGAMESALALFIEQWAGAGAFGVFLAQHRELRLGQGGAPF